MVKMSNTAESTTGLKGKLAVLAVSSVMQGANSISPILSDVKGSFPGSVSTQVQMIISIAVFTGMVSSIICGFLLRHFTKKKVLLAGLTLETAASLFCTFVNSKLLFLYLGMGVFGLGHGLITVTTSSYISENFSGNEKGTMMGFQSAVIQGVGAVLSYIAGIISARAGWNLAFLVFLIAIPAAGAAWFLLPEDGISEAPADDGSGRGSTGKLYRYAAMTFLAVLFYGSWFTNISLRVSEAGIGDASVAGTANTILGVMGIIAGVMVGKVISIAKQKTVGVATAVEGLAMLLVAFAASPAQLYLGAFLFGCSYPLRIPASMTFAATMVDQKASAWAITVMMTVFCLGEFLSPIVTGAIASLFGGGAQKVFLICGVMLLVLAVIGEMTNPVKAEDVA